MGLTTKKLQSEIVTTETEPPHYYEVRDEHGKRYCHCGTMKDVMSVWQLHTNFSYEKIYFTPPQTVDVPYVIMEPDQQLPEQKILPENQQQPLNL
jgi:hypothetical protein